jgi:hypothetical protein
MILAPPMPMPKQQQQEQGKKTYAVFSLWREMFPLESGDTPSASVVWEAKVALSGDWRPSLLGAIVAAVLMGVFRGAGFFF